MERSVIVRATFITLILSIIVSLFPVGILAANEQGEDSKSPSMSVESGEQPIEDESVALDAGKQEDRQTNSGQIEGEEAEDKKEEFKNSDYENEFLFVINKKIDILIIVVMGVLTVFLITLLRIKRIKRIKDGKHQSNTKNR
ncbi:MAG: hypothetical protein GX083_00375 [Clostridiales bacterium]|nr:hypothetical protein [Clostridiales bacterium]